WRARLLYSFDNYTLDADRRELRCGAELVAIEPQVFDLLQFLIRRRDRVVTREDILDAVWNGRAVSESALGVRINAARLAIGDNGQKQRLIRTLPRKGLRFIGDVRENGASPAPEAESTARAPTRPDVPSIAVLPFTNMSDDAEQAHFADGVSEDIITTLSRFRSLFVIARNSTFTYKGRAVDVKEVARELGVRYVLEGSVRKAGRRVRVTAQLVDAESGIHVWGERYDRPLRDIFAVQDEITDMIAATMEPEIGAAERERARRKPPEHLGAWEHHQRGMWHMLRRNREDLAKAQVFFRKAIELVPVYATPRAALALSYFFEITHGFTSNHAASLDELLEQGSQSVLLDPKDPLAHTALGLALMEHRDYSASLAEHQIAIELNPNSALAHYAFGYGLHRAERLQDALEQFDSALRLSPRDPGLWSYLTLKASTLYQLQRYDEAVRFARDAARYSIVDLIWPFVHLAAALGQLGRTAEARTAVEELRRRRPGLTVSGVRLWPHNRSRSEHSLAHMLEGLRRAGLPEQ
ncbi:MAG: winged helix-turn-helix domain-containing tetratricopeptide repeat protein, partial [Xanthobacteraceae bacterium]